MKKKSIEQFFINTILGYKPDEVLWEENNYDGFPLGQSSLRYFKFDLDGDIVRVRAHKLPNGDWKVEEVGIDNIELISLDHDLGDSAMNEYYNNVSKK